LTHGTVELPAKILDLKAVLFSSLFFLFSITELSGFPSLAAFSVECGRLQSLLVVDTNLSPSWRPHS
jgi:hypothetical protein